MTSRTLRLAGRRGCRLWLASFTGRHVRVEVRGRWCTPGKTLPANTHAQGDLIVQPYVEGTGTRGVPMLPKTACDNDRLDNADAPNLRSLIFQKPPVPVKNNCVLTRQSRLTLGDWARSSLQLIIGRSHMLPAALRSCLTLL